MVVKYLSEDRVKFIADDNLLRQVITDQAGEWKKGILELLQNSYDSLVMKGNVTNMTNIEMNIINEGDLSTLIFNDNGCGWGNGKDEIVRNMRVFGDSIKKKMENTIGEKGMGRGQAMAMIYDISRDEFIGDIVIETNGYTIYDIKLADLSFSIKKSKKEGDAPVKRKGTRWTISSTYRMFDADEISEYIQENIMIPVTIRVNGKAIKKEAKGKRTETQYATYMIVQGKGGFKVYDRGLYVKFERLGGVGGIIITKVPLKLNFARNDVLASDPIYDTVIEDAYKQVLEYVKDSNGKFNNEKRKAVKELIAKDPDVLYEFMDAPIIKTAQGKWITPEDVQDQRVYLAEEGNRLADDICQMGYHVVAEGYGKLAERAGADVVSTDNCTDRVVERAKRNRYVEYGFHDMKISDNDRKCIKYLEELKLDRNLMFGEHNSWIAWTDGKNNIWFNIKHFRKWSKAKSKAAFYLKAIPTTAHEMAHTSDNRETDYHGYAFEDEHINWMKNLMKKASTIIDREVA